MIAQPTHWDQMSGKTGWPGYVVRALRPSRASDPHIARKVIQLATVISSWIRSLVVRRVTEEGRRERECSNDFRRSLSGRIGGARSSSSP